MTNEGGAIGSSGYNPGPKHRAEVGAEPDRPDLRARQWRRERPQTQKKRRRMGLRGQQLQRNARYFSRDNGPVTRPDNHVFPKAFVPDGNWQVSAECDPQQWRTKAKSERRGFSMTLPK